MERPTDGVSLVASIHASLTVDAPITIAQAMTQLPTATKMVSTICGQRVVTTMAERVTLRSPYGLPPYHLMKM
jgi:hypothetical protein